MRNMRMIKKYGSVFVMVMLFVFVLVPFLAHADIGVGTSDSGTALPNPLCSRSNDPNCVSDFSALLNKIIDFLIEIGAVLLVIIVLIGAFQMLFAVGKPERFATGRKTIIYAVIGYAIILLAKGVELIIKDFLGASP